MITFPVYQIRDLKKRLTIAEISFLDTTLFVKIYYLPVVTDQINHLAKWILVCYHDFVQLPVIYAHAQLTIFVGGVTSVESEEAGGVLFCKDFSAASTCHKKRKNQKTAQSNSLDTGFIVAIVDLLLDKE